MASAVQGKRGAFSAAIGRRQASSHFFPENKSCDLPPGFFNPQARGKKKRKRWYSVWPVVIPVLEKIIPQSHLALLVDDPFTLFLRPRFARQSRKERPGGSFGHGRALSDDLRRLCPSGRLPGLPVCFGGNPSESVGPIFPDGQDRVERPQKTRWRPHVPPGRPGPGRYTPESLRRRERTSLHRR